MKAVMFHNTRCSAAPSVPNELFDALRQHITIGITGYHISKYTDWPDLRTECRVL